MMKFCMLCLFAGISIFPFAGAMAQQKQTILTDTVVDPRAPVSPRSRSRSAPAAVNSALVN